MSEPTATIREGHVLDLLRDTPDESVQLVATSIPYYRQRCYGTVPQTWGGRRDCEHVWTDELPGERARWGNVETLSEKQKSNGGSRQNVGAIERGSGRFCERCDAWTGELGQEPTPALFVEHVVLIFREVRRVLRSDGVCFLNVGDKYAHEGGSGKQGASTQRTGRRNAVTQEHAARRFLPPGVPSGNLLLIPERLGIALCDDGWIVRQRVTWWKGNGMCESVENRPSTTDERIWMLTKTSRYFWDRYAVLQPYALSTLPQKGASYRGNGQKAYGVNGVQDPSEVKRRVSAGLETNGGANLRNVWDVEALPEPVWKVPTKGFSARNLGITEGDHFASWPEALVRLMILAATPAAGSCGTCGRAWERLVERKPMEIRRSGPAAASGSRTMPAGTMTKLPEVRDLGWSPACACAAPTRPAVVLDPFSGTATTGAVALRYGRSYLGFELQPDYVEIGQARLEQELGMFREGRLMVNAGEPEAVRQPALEFEATP